MKAFIGALLLLPLLILVSIVTYWCVTFDINCGEHMERAAAANSIPLAREEMEVVVKYADDHNLTSGYTSVLYRSPQNDIGFWYKNMSASRDELRNVKPEATELEKSNLLIKLKESLLRHSDGDTKVTIPFGISRFPYNFTLFILWIVFGIVATVGVILIIIQLANRY
jgi:hypothetical protein